MSERRIIRAPNHLGDLVMALPALAADAGADVLVARSLAPLLGLAPGFSPGAAAGGAGGAGTVRQVIALDRGARGLLEAAGALRRARYREGVLLTPSLSSALLFALGGVRERRGARTDGRSVLLTDRVPAAALEGLHRSAAYLALVMRGASTEAPAPRLEVPASAMARWRELAGAAEGWVVGLVPGGNASSRRWEAARFAAVARHLAGRGTRVVVFGGPGERALAAQVAGDVAVNVAGRTDLPLLAAGLAACDLVVANDSGPMHLAAAVGTATVSLWGAGDPTVTGPRGAGHVLLRRPELPCVPCVRNECPRRGRGTVLARAERECLRLIEVSDVVAAVESRGGHVERERFDG